MLMGEFSGGFALVGVILISAPNNDKNTPPMPVIQPPVIAISISNTQTEKPKCLLFDQEL
jgi:hypothetical protein